MENYTFEHLLNYSEEKGIYWMKDVLVKFDDTGEITSIEENGFEFPSYVISGYTLPGFQNAHSHAFQYAMAGLAEIHPTGLSADDFWSWRKAMYKLALSVTPDQIEAIATMLYTEMVRHGYTNVAEFHYVHHDKNGKHYNNLSEMGERMISAAKTAGINITLVPIFYQKGGFGKTPTEQQKRFISPTIEDYLQLLEASKQSCRHYDGANIGIGIHSMRGVEPLDIAKIAKEGPQDIPFHIHISEQLKEVEDSIAYLGKRPVEWLLDNVELSERHHLVHATHLTSAETKGIAVSNANVVICPTTEGNLGDGLFPLIDYQNYGGNWSIGTDSHIGINPLEELRLLDYGQRLISHKRNIFTSKDEGNSGDFALKMATISGRKAMNNFEKDFFKVGEKLNAVVYSGNSPFLATTGLDRMTSSIVYTSDARTNVSTIVNGKLIDEENNNHEEIERKFIETIKELGNR